MAQFLRGLQPLNSDINGTLNIVANHVNCGIMVPEEQCLRKRDFQPDCLKMRTEIEIKATRYDLHLSFSLHDTKGINENQTETDLGTFGVFIYSMS